jgi:hypothetical protein
VASQLDKRWNFLVRRLDFCVKRLCNAVMKAMRVAIYVRVSTTEQDTQGQETELREYVERRGWTYEVYRDKGQSGAKSDRPELTRLLADLRKRKLDTRYRFAELQKIPGRRKRKDLIVVSTKKPLPNEFIRSYALVPTPSFLKSGGGQSSASKMKETRHG